MQNEEVIKRIEQHIDRLLRKMIEEKSKLNGVDFDSEEWSNQKKRMEKTVKEWQNFLNSLP